MGSGKAVISGGNGRVQDFDVNVGSTDGGAPVDHSNDDVWDAATDVPSIMDLEGTNLRRLELDFSRRTISVSDWSHP